MDNTERPIIYDYMDYRDFLNDMFRFRKKKDKYFSYRHFANKAGFSSPNFLQLVIEGKRNLTNTSLAKVAKGFGLNKQEREFFENLVIMNQARDHEEKNHYLKKMMSIRAYTKVRIIEKKSYEYFSKWYNPAIREIVLFGDRNFTSEEIASTLSPKITPREAERALNLLLELRLIEKDKDGLWQQSDLALSTGPEVMSIAVANFHREMLKLAAESLERYPANERDITGLTLRVNSGSMAEIKKRIARFRKELLEFAFDEEDTDQVIQISLQAFPLTKKDKRKG
ncbi:MAG: TIGR02147 family protein [Thermodesulfobacteriota bacterium]|nr:TIGR02147 family protein [Thermodesulfobacteriota bacterium]